PGVTVIDLLLQAGVTAINTSVTLDIYPTLGLRDGLAAVYDHLVLLDALPDQVLLVLNSNHIRQAKESGKLGVIFGTQGTGLLEGDIRWLTLYWRLGVRIMQLTYNEANAIGSGCLEPHDPGLTRFGRQVVREMNRLGLVIDLSHAGVRTSLEAAAA